MNRRDFLSSVAVVPALAIRQTPSPAAAKPGPHGLKLGTVTYNIAQGLGCPDHHQESDRSRVRRRRVADDAQARRGDYADAGAARRGEKAVRGLRRSRSAGLGTTCEFHFADQAVVRKNIDETKEWVKLAKDLGSPSVKVRPNGLVKEVPEEKTLEQIGKSLAECARSRRTTASRSSSKFTAPKRSACRASGRSSITAGNHPAVRACWNSNQTDLLDGGFDANFQLLKNQIGQIHMRDLMLEEYPWRKLIASLAEMKFQGYCFAEIPESGDPVRVLKYFRGMFRAYQNL